ncbi:two component system sensor histidine kinase, hybrid [Candidatus Magnetomorum sp. HK-1]|nr:two component system sensor histidine kinase, hybrid [Candidatus Magnetomorum sp. HK-1]
MKILIVEDDEDSRVLLEYALTSNGYEVECACDGKLGLAKAQKNRPDLIISDILMPEMDGYGLCKAVKEDEQLCTIPFIFYTATYTDPNDKKLAMDLGASKFLVKPMEINALFVEIENTLEKYQAEISSSTKKTHKKEIELQKGYSEVLAKKLDQKVHQLKEEQKRLEKSEKKYRRLVEVLREDYFFYSHDKSGFFSYISPSIYNVLGYTPEQFHLNFTTYLTDSEINKKALIKTEQSRKGIKQSTYELEIYHKNGSIHRLEVTEEPIIGNDNQIETIEGIAHDITKRVTAEKELAKFQERLQQSQKMEAIGTLAGGIAHDFNNILMPIFVFTEMIMSKLEKNSKERKNAQSVLLCAQRAKDLVKQILTFSRNNKEEKKKIFLQQQISEALKLLRASIPTTIKIRQSIDKNCSPISANPIQMHQIIMNLCTNAYQAIPNKGIMAISLSEINISSDTDIAKFNLQKGKYLRLEVSDNGIGIEKENLKKIFDPYFTTKPKDKGTGLGLSVIHGIVKDHSGHITVYSEPGQGTTFHVYFPTIMSKRDKNKSQLSENISGGNEHILLVDDDEIIVKIEKQQLENLGYQVTALTCSLKAAEIFQKAPQKFDLIITDMTMPNNTGAELSQELLKVRPSIPIILCTGFSDLIDREEALSLGVKEYLMKPFGKNEMARVVRKVLDNSKSDGLI